MTISYIRSSYCEPRDKQIEKETNKKTFSIDDHGKLITDGDYQNIFRQGRMREADIKLETDMNYNQDERQNNSPCATLKMPDRRRSSLAAPYVNCNGPRYKYCDGFTPCFILRGHEITSKSDFMQYLKGKRDSTYPAHVMLI